MACSVEEAISVLLNNEEETLVLTAPPGPRELSRICTALQKCWRLRRLVLRGLRLRPAAVQDLLAALDGNDTLEVLDLSYNELGDPGIKLVLVSLTMGDSKGSSTGSGVARRLHTLLLDSNGLDEHGAGVLALLGLQHPLRKVSLRCNKLGDRAALLLAGTLPGQSAIEELDLRDNDIGVDGVTELVAMVERGRGCLRVLHLQVYAVRLSTDFHVNRERDMKRKWMGEYKWCRTC